MKSFSKHSDQELISFLKEGKYEAFDEIYHRYSTKVLRFANTFFLDKTEAEDVVQEVFVNVWVKRKELKKEQSIKSFLFTCVKNRIYNKLRDQKKNARLEEHELNSLVDETSLGVESFHDKRKLVAFEILRSLPTGQQNIFTLSKRDGYSHQEIAQKLNISIRTVEHHIYLAKKHIKASLVEQSLWLYTLALLLF